MADDNKIEETLSALMDGEASELEIRRAIREVSDHSVHRDTWRRYQLASAAMKRDLPRHIPDLSSRISAAIDQESSLSSPVTRFVQPLGRVAIAASVAVLAVVGVQQVQWSDSSQSSPAMASRQGTMDSGDAQFQLPAGYDLPPVSGRTVSAGSRPDYQTRPTVVVSARPAAKLDNEQAVRDYFNTMMSRHTQSAAGVSSSQGVLPFARLPQDER